MVIEYKINESMALAKNTLAIIKFAELIPSSNSLKRMSKNPKLKEHANAYIAKHDNQKENNMFGWLIGV